MSEGIHALPSGLAEIERHSTMRAAIHCPEGRNADNVDKRSATRPTPSVVVSVATNWFASYVTIAYFAGEGSEAAEI